MDHQTRSATPPRRVMRGRHSMSVALVAGVAAVAAAACGSSSSSNPAASTTVAAGSTTAADASKSNCTAAAKQLVDAASAPLTPKVPAQQIDMSKLKGKTVYYLSLGSGYSQLLGDGFASAARAAGLNPVISNGATPESWNQAIQEAVSRRAVGIFVGTGHVPAIMAKSVAQAKAGGIPTVQENSIPPDPAGIAATVLVPTDVGKVIAAYAALDNGCKVDAVVAAPSSQPGLVAIGQSATDEFKRLCPDTCKTQNLDINLETMSTTAAPALESALRQNPSVNVVLPTFDSLALLFQPALAQSGSKARVYSFDGNTPNLDQLRKGAQRADYAYAPPNYQGYINVDTLARTVLKVPSSAPAVQLQLFTVGNISKSDSFSALWPKLEGFQSEYMKAWGLS
jgi:DNA-binding LacI/PurR family transcriptional regulator